MKRRLVSFMLVLCMLISLIPTTAFAAVGSVEDGEPNRTINYVSLGDSMTNGYGLDGYDGDTGVYDYGADSYANRFAAWLAKDGATVNHSRLAMSGMRAEDLHWLLELDYTDNEAIAITDGAWDEETWNAKFTTGDYWTWDELCDNYRFSVAATYILAANGDEEAATALESNPYSRFVTSNEARIVAETYQKAVEEADIITLGMGNGNFGVFMLGRILEAIGFSGEPADAMVYDIDNAIRECDPAMRQLLWNLLDTLKAEMATMGIEIDDGDDTTTTMMEALSNTVLYTTISYALNYAGSVDAILKLNSDAQIILVALINTLEDSYEVESVTVGQLMDVVFEALNVYIAALPAYMQATNNTAYEEAEFYYAEAPTVEGIAATFDETVTGTKLVRQRFFWNIVKSWDGSPGMIWGLLAGVQLAPGVAVDYNFTLNDIVAYERLSPTEKAAYAANDSTRQKAINISVYLAFEDALIKAGVRGEPIAVESLMGLSNLSFELFAPVIADFSANIGANGDDYLSDVCAFMAATAEATLESTVNGLLAEKSISGEVNMTVTPEQVGAVIAGTEGAADAIAANAVKDIVAVVDDVYVDTVVNRVYEGIETLLSGINETVNGTHLTSLSTIPGCQMNLTVDGYYNTFVSEEWTGSYEQKLQLVKNFYEDASDSAGFCRGKLDTYVQGEIDRIEDVASIPEGSFASQGLTGTVVVATAYSQAQTALDAATAAAETLQTEDTIAAATEAYLDDMLGSSAEAYIAGQVSAAVTADNANMLCMLLALPETLSSSLQAAPEPISGLLAIFSRMKLGDGVGSHPSADGHEMICNAVVSAYESGYTATDETLKNLNAAWSWLKDYAQTNYPDAYCMFLQAAEYMESEEFAALCAQLKDLYEKADAATTPEQKQAIFNELGNMLNGMQEIAAKVTYKKYEVTEDSYYVSIGDSTLTGYGLDKYTPGVNNGEGQVLGDEAPVLLAQKLFGDDYEAHFKKLDKGGIRVDDLLVWMGDNSFQDDFYQRYTIDANAIEKNTEYYQDLYISEIEKADLITVALGGGNVTTFVGQQINRMIADEPLYEMAWTKYFPEADLTEIYGYIDSLQAVLAGTLPEIYGVSVEELAPVVAESFLFGMVGYVTNYTKVLDRIHEINPDAHVVVVGYFNPADALSFSVTVGDEVVEIPAGGLVGALVEICNVGSLSYALANLGDTTYAPISDATTILDEKGITDTAALLNGIFVEPWLTHAGIEGHKYIADQIYTAITTDYTAGDFAEDVLDGVTDLVERHDLFNKLYALLEQYGPEMMENAYAYAVENGYIAQLEAAVEALKADLEAKTKEFVETAKPAVEAKIAELKAELAALEAELKDLYDALEAKKAELEAQLNKAEADASAAIKEVIANIEAMIEEIEGAIATVEATIKSVSEMIETLEAKLKALETELADLVAAIKTLEEALDALINAVENAGGVIDSAVAAYEAARTAALAAIDTIETLYKQVSTLVNGVNTIAGKIADKVEGAYAFVTDALNAAYAALSDKVGAEIEAQLKALETKLVAEKAKVEAAVKAATEKLWAAAEGEIAELEAAIAAKKAELESAVGAAKAELEAQLKALETELAAKKAELETAVNNAKAEIEAQIAALEAELLAKKAELENAIGEAKAQIEAQIAELEAAIAAKKAELEAAVNAAKADLEAQIAALEAEIAELKAKLETAVNNAKAEIEAQLKDLEAELAAKKAEVEAAVKTEAEKLWAAAEAEIAELEAQIAELKAKLETAVGDAKAEIEAQIEALEAEVKTVIATVEATVKKAAQEAFAVAVEQVEAVVDFADAKVDEVIGAIEDMYVDATTDEYEVGADSYYVALGDGSAESKSYVDKVAATLNVPFKNLAVDGQTIGKAPAHIVANAAEIMKADLITLGYGNNTFAENAFDRAISALLGDPVETYDWVALIGAEGAAYVEQALVDIKADLVESGLDVTMTAYGFETDLASAVTLAVEAYAYATVEYLYALPTVIGTIREINPDAVVAIVGMYNPMDEVTLTFEDVSIDIGEYLDYLVKGADVYGTSFCMLFPNAIYVSAPDAQTEITANDYNLVNFLFRYMNGRVNMNPNDAGHEYTYQQIMNALTVSEAPVTFAVGGTVTSFGDGNVTVALYADGSSTAKYTTTVTGTTATYSFSDVEAGTYTMKVSKANHVTREYTVVVTDTAVTQDAKIHLLGDINGDGKVNTSDVARANAHAKKTVLLADYEFACADITGDGKVNTSDVARANAHAKKTLLLW